MLKLLILFCWISASSLQALEPATPEEYSVVILGSGVAALTAAVQVSQAGHQPLVITGTQPGGIIVQSHSVQNWPGEMEITGAELIDKLQKQAEARGAAFLPAHVIHIDTSQRPFTLTTKILGSMEVKKIKAQTCIIAMGAFPKLLQIPGERENLFRHIFTCAPCDALRFKDKTVAIIGGGDSALSEAHYLSNIANKIYLIVRKDHLKGGQQKPLTSSKIEILYNTSVTAFEESNTQLVLHLKTPTSSQELLVDGAFLAIGSQPNTTIFKGKLALDEEGYILLSYNQETSVPGIFAAGDVCDKHFRQAMTAAGDATKAALQAQTYITSTTTPPSPSTKPIEFKEISTLHHLRDILSTAKRPTLVYFYSPNCLPCQAFKFTYNKWALDFRDKALFVKVNGQVAHDCFSAYHIQGVPSVIVFDKKGKMVQQATGLQELLQLTPLLEKKLK